MSPPDITSIDASIVNFEVFGNIQTARIGEELIVDQYLTAGFSMATKKDRSLMTRMTV
jgi:hypothetical protein